MTMTTAASSFSSPDWNAIRDEDFRAMVRGWIEENYPPEIRNAPNRLRWNDTKEWYFRLALQGWLAPAWPGEWGGMGLDASKQVIMMEEQERYGCARISDYGIIMLGPLLLRFGTEEQKRIFLPRIITGEHIWCQGYSEPNAGSDLASLTTRAELVDGQWVINGQKTWTTLAQDANWMFMLVRTGRGSRPQEGITFLLMPMDAPGVELRPIANLEMREEFCEVFLTDVKVPMENVVGEVGQGWRIAKALLGHERVFIGSPAQATRALGQLRRLGVKRGLEGDPVFEDAFVRLAMEVDDHKSLYRIYIEHLRQGQPIGADVSVLKLFQSETYQRITDAILEFSGESFADPTILGSNSSTPAGAFLKARTATIFGGSSEIQRNILAKAVLDLR